MSVGRIAKLFIGLFVSLSVYLLVVGIWASASIGELLPEGAFVNESQILSQEQLHILLKIEDPTFFEHPGIDISAGQGLTTLTSSLARNVFLGHRELSGVKGMFQKFYKSVFACCKKIDFGRDVMALVLNRHISKNQQLNLFVSRMYFGQHNGKGLVGFSAAAKAYFDKPLVGLDRKEFMMLVAMLKSPNYYHPIKGKLQLQSRVSRINAILTGACTPRGWLDTKYEHCEEKV